MENLKQSMISTWKNEIKKKFVDGKLVYERQLQADLYHLLKRQLENGYEIWVEPVIYMDQAKPPNKDSVLHMSKPDLIITKGEEIIAVIELKFKPWEEVDYKGDLDKLIEFKKISTTGKKIWLGIKPLSSDWKDQNKDDNFDFYNLKENLLTSFIVFARPDSHAISDFNIYKGTSNFLLLYGYIEDENNLIFDHQEFS